MVDTKQSSVERGNDQTKLWVLHNSEEIAFAYSEVRGYYENVGLEILKNGQKVPTGDYTASLVNAAFGDSTVQNEPEFEKVREVVRNKCLWVFNKDLWTSSGVYVLQDLEATGRSQPLDVAELEKMLKGGKELEGIRFSQDKKLRFAPTGSYVLGYHTPESLAKDGFMIASCGKEGAIKLGEASSKFRNNPYTNGLNIQEERNPELRVSTLGEYDDRLWFGGEGWNNFSGMRAFGVL